MRLDAPHISKLRLQRYHRWTLLWLKWFAAFLSAASAYNPLSAEAKAIAHQWLDRIEQILVCIVLIRAAPKVRMTNALKHSARRRLETHFLRALVGSAMRRDLRSPHLIRRIEALSQDIDALIARVLKRLPRGLTRRRPFIARPEMRAPDVALVVCASAALIADTS